MAADIARRIKKVGRYHQGLFALPVLSLLFYGWLTAPALNSRPDNPHRTAPVYRRGAILDRHGQVLAKSIGKARVYPRGRSVGSLVGYQLRGKNASGLESVLGSELSPALPPSTLWAAIDRDRQGRGASHELGPEVQLTIDSSYQERLFNVLGERAGAVLVCDREGGVLAAVSNPSIDSNFVQRDWAKLRENPRAPFIERVGGGLYPVLRPTGEALFPERQEGVSHWFHSQPFPLYPLGSPAVKVEGRLLVSPLMLMECLYGLAEIQPSPSLHLLGGQGGSRPVTLPSLELESRRVGEAHLWSLLGGAFKQSPKFVALLGECRKDRFFVVILEESRSESMSFIEEELLPVIVGPLGG